MSRSLLEYGNFNIKQIISDHENFNENVSNTLCYSENELREIRNFEEK